MHRSSSGRAAILALAVLAGGELRASPTPNEFEVCHKLGGELLRHCLDKAPGRLDTACWQQSRERTTACYVDVQSAHDRGLQRARAEREARAARRAGPADEVDRSRVETVPSIR